MKTLAEFVKERRKEVGLTQEEFAGGVEVEFLTQFKPQGLTLMCL